MEAVKNPDSRRDQTIERLIIHIDKKEDARTAPTPITTYALFYDGKYLTNEQMNDAKFLKLAGQ